MQKGKRKEVLNLIEIGITVYNLCMNLCMSHCNGGKC